MRYVSILFFTLFSFSTFAQIDANVEDTQEDSENREPRDWRFHLQIGATADWTFNDKWAGSSDGNYFNIGGKIKGVMHYLHLDHDWINTLSIQESFAKSPSTDFRKATDRLSFESLYKWAFGGWWGAFGQFNLDTSIFSHTEYRKDLTTFNIVGTNGAVTTQTGTELRLTDPFSPLYLKETIGLFATPVNTEPFTWDIRVGGQAREILANGQLVVTSATATTVNLRTLTNFYELGPMAGTHIHGDLIEKRLSYKAGIEAMFIAWASPNTPTGDFVDRLNVDALAEVSLKLTDWASLSWEFKALRMPEIRKDFQLQSRLWLTANWEF